MTQEAPAPFDPSSAIGTALRALFGQVHADRWPECVAASLTDQPMTWHDLAAALVVWLAYVDDGAEVATNLRSLPIVAIDARGPWGTSSIRLDTIETLPGLDFVRRSVLDAVVNLLIESGSAALLQSISIWEDSDGRSAVELNYGEPALAVKVTYGDTLASVPLLSVRTLDGGALRIIQRALLEASGVMDDADDLVLGGTLGRARPRAEVA